jgi:hypothetical protein
MTARVVAPLLFVSGTITLVYGYFTPWFADGWFRMQDQPAGTAYAMVAMFTMWGAFAVDGWLAYVGLAYRGKQRHPSPGIAKVAVVTAVLAAITLALAIVLLVAAYGARVPHGSAEMPEQIASVTASPWLVIEGSTSLAIAGWLLWRQERAAG